MADSTAVTQPVSPECHPTKLSPCFGKVQYIYLLRVPVLMGLAIFFLPIVSLYCLRELLGNLFIVRLSNIFWTLLATEMLVFGILVVARVVLLNGLERFRIPQGLSKDVIRWPWLVVTQVLALPMFLALIFSNGQAADPAQGWGRLTAGVAAVLVAFVAAFLVLLLSVLISQRYKDDPVIPAHERFPLPFGFMKKWIDYAYNTTLNFPEIKNWFKNTIPTWPPALRDGYFDRETWLPYPGQLLSFSMLIVSYALYQIIGYLKHQRLGMPFEVPAIAYIVVLLIVLTWMLSMAAFFLDYYRLPLLIPGFLFVFSTNFVTVSDRVSFALQPFIGFIFIPAVLFVIASFCWTKNDHLRRVSLLILFGLLFVANLISDTDHFYEIRSHAEVAPITPYEVLSAAARLNPTPDHPNGRITVVATAGGGIQAAAWTAQVLTGLQKEIPADSPTHSFANSIAAISSVSGGAVGTMFFASRYQSSGAEQGFPSHTNPSKIVQDAEFPALGDVAWAMVYPDFTRALVPFLKWGSQRLVDRGWALEQTWRIRGHLDATLNDWRDGVKEGSRPALLFNSTIVESGEPYVLATADLNREQLGGIGRETFHGLLPKYDIPIVTAVRLAASFPFVTPASRALLPESDPNFFENDVRILNNVKYHAVDGGYYDNYGVNSLLAFLNEALNAAESNHTKAPDILIVLIRSFPSDAESPRGQSRGWFYQGWAPMAALLEVRTTGQLVRDREAIDNFTAYWGCRGVKIVPATFEFPGTNAPLSWQMNKAQIDEVSKEWDDRIHGPENQDWLQASCFFHPGGQGCDSPVLAHKKAW